jgi:hypothetical protein
LLRAAFAVDEVASMLGIPEGAVDDAIDGGELRAVHLAGVELIPTSELRRVLGE